MDRHSDPPAAISQCRQFQEEPDELRHRFGERVVVLGRNSHKTATVLVGSAAAGGTGSSRFRG